MKQITDIQLSPQEIEEVKGLIKTYDWHKLGKHTLTIRTIPGTFRSGVFDLQRRLAQMLKQKGVTQPELDSGKYFIDLKTLNIIDWETSSIFKTYED